MIRLARWCVHLWALLWLLPVYFMAVFATRGDAELFSPVPPLLPGGQGWHNLVDLEQKVGFSRALFNSLLVSLSYTLLALLVCSLAGFALARYRFWGKSVAEGLLLASMSIPYFVVVVPQFILTAGWLDLMDNPLAVILPPLASAIGVFYMRQIFVALPGDVLEAARLDGASEARIFWTIALPLVRPALAALALILFLGSWNDYLWPLLMLPSAQQQTAPVALGSLIGLTTVSWGSLMMGSLLLTVPLLGLFAGLQQTFVEGLSAGVTTPGNKVS